MTRLPLGIASSVCVFTVLAAGARGAEDDSAADRAIPAALAPFEYLVGTWKGQAVPMNNPAQRFRGWPETHTWAWIFKGGEPVGLAVQFTGDKTLASGRLTHDPGRGRYRFEVKTPAPAAKTAVMLGTFDAKSKILALETADGDRALADKVRLTLRPNGSFIRYTLAEERQAAGDTVFHRALEVGLLREGESLAGAGGGDSADRPKCVVTGGAATMTVSFKGASYPLCCTGCRDEFNDNPEKYIKKAALLAAAQAKKPKTAAPARVGRFDDDFSDDVAKSPAPAAAAKSMTKPAQSTKSADAKTAEKAKPAPKKDASKNDASRAASVLRLGQSLEKRGNVKAALTYYKRVVKDFPDAPAAKTAAERVKALEDQ